MLKVNQGKILSTALLVLSCVGATPGSCNRVPKHAPYLMDLERNRCIRFKLVDADKLTYQVDTYDNPQGLEPCSDLQGGFGFPAGQLEALLQYVRDEKKACEKP